MISPGPRVRADSTLDTVARAASHDHVVQFYESEEFLLGIVSGFLAAGLRAGQPVMAIASARRLGALSRRLGSAGVDVEAAERAGRVAWLDAEAVLAEIVVDGEPSWDRFRSAVARRVERLSEGSSWSRVRAYGEMVDLLCGRGASEAALRLEEMWNDLARTHAVSLLCAYAMAGFPEERDGANLRRVCGAHAYVIPAESWASAGDGDARAREVARLQQRARALEREVEHRRALELALQQALEERALLEEQMRGRNEDLARAVRLSEAFVGMLGHDLRNPLNAIATAGALLARRPECERNAKHASRIVRSARRMARMIDQILDFTRIRLGKGLPIDPRPIDLADLCRHATDELEGETDAPRVRLEVRGDVGGTWDADRLAQLVSNLVGNALVHGTAGQPVAIRLDGTAPDEVSLEVENAGTIPRDLLPAMFEPFGASSGRRAASSGLGLGLHISRQIALAHGGAIDVASSDEGWTRFTVRLPRAPPARC